MNDYIIAVILGIVEGITEFLPISSTGHLIIVNEYLNFTGQFAQMFDVVIQFGAILSVVIYFRHDLFPVKSNRMRKREAIDIWKKAIVGVLPALVAGALVADIIEEKLFNVTVVSITLIIGGILLIIIDKRKRRARINSIQSLPYLTAFMIGIFQCLAMVPGTSRSAATIIGAMLLGASRQVAAEFSFFIAIPTMLAASSYTFLKTGIHMNMEQATVLGIGFVTSFLVAWAVIAWLMKFIQRNNFVPFGYYRIIIGAILLIFFVM